MGGCLDGGVYLRGDVGVGRRGWREVRLGEYVVLIVGRGGLWFDL